jgi:hypothetical protein
MYLAGMLQRTLPAGHIAACLPNQNRQVAQNRFLAFSSRFLEILIPVVMKHARRREIRLAEKPIPERLLEDRQKQA